MPLPLPPIVFRLPKKATKQQHQAILDLFKTSEIKTLPEGGGPQGYVVNRPSWSDFTRIQRLGIPQTSSPGDCIQVVAIPSLRTLYQCIELFLRVNTYYYRRSDAIARLQRSDPEAMDGIDPKVMLAFNGTWYLGGTKRKAELVDEADFRTALTNPDQWENTLKHKTACIVGGDAVLVAKPSPKPFQASLGSPTEVPFAPGLLFPYFSGMLTCDTTGLRVLAGKLFFRNFGDISDSDARRGFQAFRNVAGIIASSPVGSILGHILKGFELALDAQAHCFLIFDNSDYLGFALLGDHFHVHNGTEWVEPMESTDLRVELQRLATHETTLLAIIEALATIADLDGNLVLVEKEEIDTASGLLSVLATVDETQSEGVQELGRLIKGLHFSGSFLEIGPKSIEWALSMLSEDKDQSLGDRCLFIPLSGWSDCASREFQVFAAFGPRAFHLNNRRGTRIPIPKKETDVDIFASMSGEPPSPTYPKILVYPCTVDEAVKKWRELKKTATLVMDFEERAQNSRAMRWEGESKELIWMKLKELAANGVFNEAESKDKGKAGPRGTKRQRDEDFDLDAILGL